VTSTAASLPPKPSRPDNRRKRSSPADSAYRFLLDGQQKPAEDKQQRRNISWQRTTFKYKPNQRVKIYINNSLFINLIRFFNSLLSHASFIIAAPKCHIHSHSGGARAPRPSNFVDFDLGKLSVASSFPFTHPWAQFFRTYRATHTYYSKFPQEGAEEVEVRIFWSVFLC
jgi:hypothetical protein